MNSFGIDRIEKKYGQANEIFQTKSSVIFVVLVLLSMVSFSMAAKNSFNNEY